MARGPKRSNGKIGQNWMSYSWLAAIPVVFVIAIYGLTIYQGIAEEEQLSQMKPSPSSAMKDVQKSFSAKSPPPLRDDITLTTQSIEEVEWSDDESFLQSVIKSKRPVLIRNSTVKDWEIMVSNFCAMYLSLGLIFFLAGLGFNENR